MPTLEELRNGAIVVACFVGIATLSFQVLSNRTKTRQDIWHSMFTDFQKINDYIDTHDKDLSHPPYKELLSNSATSTLLFHHINLVFRFWIGRKLLPWGERQGFMRWMDEIFFYWLSTDKKIRRDFEIVLEFKDLYPNRFISWLEKRFKRYEKIRAKENASNRDA